MMCKRMNDILDECTKSPETVFFNQKDSRRRVPVLLPFCGLNSACRNSDG